MDTAVQICLNASALHPAGRLPHLFVGASPYIGRHNDPTNTDGDTTPLLVDIRLNVLNNSSAMVVCTFEHVH